MQGQTRIRWSSKRRLWFTRMSCLLLMPALAITVQRSLTSQNQKTEIKTAAPLPFTSSGWVVHGGCWDFSHRIISAQATVGCCRAYLANKIYRDFTFEVRLNKLAEDGAIGIIFRYDEASHTGYRFEIYPHGGHILALVRGADREGELWHSTAIVMNRGCNTWNLIRITCRGKRIEIYSNGELANIVEDSAFSSGRIGLFIGGDPRQRAEFEILTLEEHGP